MRIGLPAYVHATTASKPATRATRSSKRGPSKETELPPHALVIEDDAVIATLLAELLEGMGYECGVEVTEADAIAAASLRRPSLMIVDVRLSEGSGITAVEHIFRAGPIPHVFITGDPSRVHARRVDAVVVQKPFREPDLTSAIQLVLAAAS